MEGQESDAARKLVSKEVKLLLQKLKKKGQGMEGEEVALPKSFHMDNYQDVGKWGFIDWFYALSFRLELFLHWKQFCENQREEDDVESFKYLRGRTKKLLECPLEFIREPAPVFEKAMREISLLDLTNLINHKTALYADAGVDSLEDYLNDQINEREPFYQLPDLKDDDVRKLFKAKLAMNENDELSHEISEVMAGLPASSFNDSFHEWPRYTIAVNLEAPDSLIMSQLKDWLKATRKQTKTPFFVNPISAKELEKWVKLRVLPYIDLRLFAWAHGFDFTIPEMHKNIVGESHRWPTEEALRKQTKPLMEEIMTQRYIRSLLYSVPPQGGENTLQE